MNDIEETTEHLSLGRKLFLGYVLISMLALPYVVIDAALGWRLNRIAGSHFNHDAREVQLRLHDQVVLSVAEDGRIFLKDKVIAKDDDAGWFVAEWYDSGRTCSGGSGKAFGDRNFNTANRD